MYPPLYRVVMKLAVASPIANYKNDRNKRLNKKGLRKCSYELIVSSTQTSCVSP
mgnify:CR=1 FL=1